MEASEPTKVLFSYPMPTLELEKKKKRALVVLAGAVFIAMAELP